MRAIYSEGWVNVLNEIDEFAAQVAGPVWFRGHSSSNHKLQSGLFRMNLPAINDYLAIEQNFYQYYQSIGYLLHEITGGWELIYSLQHHGGKTRLLDWSESFTAALYFSVYKWIGERSSVWMLDPLALNCMSIGRPEIVSPGPDILPYPDTYFSGQATHSIAVYPIKNTRRISSQHGVFTVQGNYPEPLNEEFSSGLVRQGSLKVIELTEELRSDAIRFLKMNGINHFTLFPDLDGLAGHLNNILDGRQSSNFVL